MIFRSHTFRYAAVIFIMVLLLSLSGLLIYMLWFSPPPEPPPRSRPVVQALASGRAVNALD